MTWEIITGLITLVSACLAVCKIVANNTRAVTEVRCSVDGLNRTVQTQIRDLADIRAEIGALEVRLARMEERKGK